MSKTYVWDRFVRSFHWIAVVAFFTAYLTGEEDSALHTYAGYLLGILVISRIVWGFIGSPHARFSDFVCGPRGVITYLKGFVGGAVRHYLGHNPAGGWMVLALLLGLTLTVASGIEVLGLEGHGPLARVQIQKPDPTRMDTATVARLNAARRARHDAEEWWEEIHELAANVTLGLVGIHVVGVVAASLRHRENLVRAMVTGYKDSPGEFRPPRSRSSRT